MALIRYLKGLSVDGNIKFEGSALISSNTADGADNAQLSLAGGGADSDGRGARIRLYGNEHASLAGAVDISTGNVAGSDMYLTATDNMTFSTGGTATFTGNVQIDGNLTVDGTINHGGGGIFNGDQAIVTAGYNNTFTLTRATTGTLIFDVWFTSETGTASSVAKKYTVAHSYNKTPVYNKIIDTGPGTGNSDTNDFLVQFTNSNTGATGTSMLCIIKAEGAAQNISYTVQVGHDNANALTFTPNS